MHSSLDPNTLGDPYARGSRPDSVISTSTNGIESAWRRRQTIKRGVTRKVKLTHGNFIAEYPVPTPVHTAIEAKWSGTKSTEFSYVFIVMMLGAVIDLPSLVICGILRPPATLMSSTRRMATLCERRCTIVKRSY